MARSISRATAESKFAKTQQESKSVIDAERDAVRAKTARLRAERLAKEAAEGVTVLARLETKLRKPIRNSPV